MNSKSIMVYGPQLTKAETEQNAREGSARLLISICQYHAKYHKLPSARQYWARKGLTLSFEVAA